MSSCASTPTASIGWPIGSRATGPTPRISPKRHSCGCSDRWPNTSPGTFEGWLHRITTNLFLDLARRRQRIRFEALPDDAGDRLASAEAGPELAYSQNHLDPEIQAALDELPPDFRAAVVLCDLEQLSYEEIAATLNVKVGTVRSRIHRGRVLLREALAHRAPGVRPTEPADQRAPRSVGLVNFPIQHLSDEAVAAFADGMLARVGAQSRRAPPRASAPSVRARSTSSGRLYRSLRAAPAPALSGWLARAAASGAGDDHPHSAEAGPGSGRLGRLPGLRHRRRLRPAIGAARSAMPTYTPPRHEFHLPIGRPHAGRRTQQLALVAVAAAMITVGLAASASADTASSSPSRSVPGANPAGNRPVLSPSRTKDELVTSVSGSVTEPQSDVGTEPD